MSTHTYLWRTIEGVGVEYGLYHDKRLSHVFTIELVTVISTLIGAVVKHLKELGSS